MLSQKHLTVIATILACIPPLVGGASLRWSLGLGTDRPVNSGRLRVGMALAAQPVAYQRASYGASWPIIGYDAIRWSPGGFSFWYPRLRPALVVEMTGASFDRLVVTCADAADAAARAADINRAPGLAHAPC
jgi:hypothetical protein